MQLIMNDDEKGNNMHLIVWSLVESSAKKKL